MKRTVKKTPMKKGEPTGALRAQRANQKRLKEVSAQMRKTRGK